MISNQNIPKLRFKGFEGEWNVKLLKDVFLKVSERNVNNEYKNVLTNSAVSGIVNQLDFFDKDIANHNNLLNYYVVCVGDFIYNPRISKSAPVGPLNRNNLKKGIMSPLYTVIRPKEKNADFFEKYFQTKFWHRYMYKIANYGARFDRMSILANDFFKMPLFFPKKDEQQKISSFLIKVDEWIGNLKEQKENLEKYKKGIMQKIFAQKIRFKDKDGKEFEKWKEEELGKYLIQHHEKTNMNDQYPVLTSSHRGIFFQKDYFDGEDVSSKNTTGYNVVPKGFFTYRHMSDTLVFKFNINDIVDKGIVSTLYPVFKTKDINDYFLLMKLNNGNEFRKYAILQKQGGSRTYMYYSKLIELKLNLPSLIEQQKIAEFFTSINEFINSNQKQIAKAEEWKKGLIQGLFV